MTQSAIMNCSYCEAPMPEVSAFCPACGQAVPNVEEVRTNDPREKILGALSYLGMIPALVFLAIPALRSKRFIRFHSWQSLLFFVSTVLFGFTLRLLFVIFSLLPFVGFLLAWLSSAIGFFGVVTLWVVLVLKAVQGSAFELPLIGPLAGRLAVHK